MRCKLSGACLSAGVIVIKLQSGFVEIALLNCCSPADLLRVCEIFFLNNTSGGLLLNKDDFTYDF